MAGVVGNSGAGYATVQPIANNPIGDSMAYTENQGFRYRAEKIKKDELDAAKKAKEAEDLDKDLKTFSPTLTQNQNTNDAIVDYATQAKYKYAEAAELYNTTRDPKYKKQMNGLMQSFDIAKQAPAALNAKVAEIQEGIKSDKYNEASLELVKKKLRALETGKARIYPDENGVMRIDLYDSDENGKPTAILDKGLDATAYFKQITPKTNYDFNKEATTFLANNKLDKTKIQQGFTTITKQQVDDAARQQAEAQADAIVNNDDKLFQRWKDLTGEVKENFTPEDKAYVKKATSDYLVKAYEQDYEKDIDQAGALASSKDRREQQEKATRISTPVISRQEGVIHGSDYKIPKGSRAFTIDGVQTKLGEGRQERLKDVRVTPQGKVVMVVEETFEDQSTTEKRPTESALKRIQDSKGKLTEADLMPEDYTTTTTKNKDPQIKVYDSNDNANEFNRFSTMVDNPLNKGKRFTGANQFVKYFKAKAGVTSSGEKISKEKVEEINNTPSTVSGGTVR